jgi:cytochrome b561
MVLHWIIAGLIVLQYILARLAELAEKDAQIMRELALLANHKSIGLTVLGLMFVRMIWRFITPPPPLPIAMPDWQKKISHITHWILYGLIILIPLSGWFMSSATAYSVSWFNLVQIPDFISPDKSMAELYGAIHESLASLLVVIAIAHILAALKHHFIDKDEVLSRMSSIFTIALFIIVIVTGVIILNPKDNEKPTTKLIVKEKAEPLELIESNLPLWTIDYKNSFIHFSGYQAGAEFNGVWKDWTAEIRFEIDNLDSSIIDVTVNTAKYDTQDEERDDYLGDKEWLDIKQYPEAYYRANSFSQSASGDVIANNGQLIIKGFAAPVKLEFTVETFGNRRILVGSAEMMRLDLGIGLGEWEDTDWVSNSVIVKVRVEATITSSLD